MVKRQYIPGVIFLCSLGSSLAVAQQPPNAAPPMPMSFFITSSGSGKGADLGGLAGADQRCQMLATADHTCQNWTSSTMGTAQLGHFDRTGGGNTSWNSAHPSRGCSQENLVSTGGAGLFYCFATN